MRYGNKNTYIKHINLIINKDLSILHILGFYFIKKSEYSVIAGCYILSLIYENKQT